MNDGKDSREELARALAENGVDNVEQMLGAVPVYKAPPPPRELKRTSATRQQPQQQQDPKQQQLASMNGEGEVERRIAEQRERRFALGIATFRPGL